MSSVQESSASPCRISVLLARAASEALVLRRGPSRWVQLLRWRTDCDEFHPGQWFKGRIYDRRSDLSPLGTRFIYFASKIDRRTIADREHTYAWTAVSRPPYFTALALWPKGDCWHGGGLFESETEIWLNHHPDVATPHPGHVPPSGLRVAPNPEAHGEDAPIWRRRMIRDGWRLAVEGSYPYRNGAWQTEAKEVWERSHPTQDLILRRTLDAIDFEAYGGPYVESFSVIRAGSETPIESARWADFDYHGRLVFARGGCLYASAPEEVQHVERPVVDLNSNLPEAVVTPDWALRWS